MKFALRRAIAAAFLVLGSLSALAQEKQADAPALYRLQTAHAVMYLFGSIHVGAPDMYPLPARVAKAFGDCESLVVEVNLLEIDPTAVLGTFMEKFRLPEGRTLDALITAEQKQRLVKALAGYGIPWNTVAGMKPFFADSLITELKAVELGYDAANGIDLYFINQASNAAKKILALETAEFQLEAISGLPDATQAAMLASTLDDLDATSGELAELLAAWRRGDLDACAAIIEASYVKNSALEPVKRILIDNRNTTMAAKLKEMVARGGTYFVVIGAGHLAGKGSVIEQLAAAGYQVAPVPTARETAPVNPGK